VKTKIIIGIIISIIISAILFYLYWTICMRKIKRTKKGRKNQPYTRLKKIGKIKFHVSFFGTRQESGILSLKGSKSSILLVEVLGMVSNSHTKYSKGRKQFSFADSRTE